MGPEEELYDRITLEVHRHGLHVTGEPLVGNSANESAGKETSHSEEKRVAVEDEKQAVNTIEPDANRDTAVSSSSAERNFWPHKRFTVVGLIITSVVIGVVIGGVVGATRHKSSSSSSASFPTTAILFGQPYPTIDKRNSSCILNCPVPEVEACGCCLEHHCHQWTNTRV